MKSQIWLKKLKKMRKNLIQKCLKNIPKFNKIIKRACNKNKKLNKLKKI